MFCREVDEVVKEKVWVVSGGSLGVFQYRFIKIPEMSLCTCPLNSGIVEQVRFENLTTLSSSSPHQLVHHNTEWYA